MPRLFFGISLPSHVKDQLDRLTEGVPSARWVPEDNFHVTLAFLGDVSTRQVADVEQAAHSVRAEAFSLKLESVGIFPKRPPAKVLWVGLTLEPLLLRLQKKLERELSFVGYEPEPRKFHPHVTLARLSRDAPRESVSDWLARFLNFRSDVFPVTRFQLYSSVLTSGGSEYQVLGTYPIRR